MSSGGIEFHQAHFPGQAPIDAYGNGGFRFADMSHKGAILCLPSGIYAWHSPELATQFDVSHFDRLLKEADSVEILLIGSGINLVPIPEKLKEHFRSHRISADSMATGAAVRTYNVLVSEGRAIACALLPV